MWELERQNKITQQILESFLEKKLALAPASRPPSIWDIIPKHSLHMLTRNNNSNSNNNNNNNQTDPESLESSESEQFSSFYSDEEQGDEGEIFSKNKYDTICYR